ncbi:MAG: hypothetical protein JWL72_1553 [Ilumatobacteraceae bacterium]|nr:hypothetical protein [Ilumatobacteraceae bacterium]
MELRLHTLAERPDLEASADDMPTTWEEYMTHDLCAGFYFSGLDRFAEHVIYGVSDEAPDVVIAKAFSIPFVLEAGGRRPDLPMDGWDRVVLWGCADHAAGRQPNIVSAIEIAIHRDWQGRHLSRQMVIAMRNNVARLGFERLVAPVRPNGKHREPDTPMSEYAFRTRADGLPYDDWLRVHVRLGGRIVQVAPTSMAITGSLAEWREWTGMAFDTTGRLHVPGALSPIRVDVEHDNAVYIEPNVWVEHLIR